MDVEEGTQSPLFDRESAPVADPSSPTGRVADSTEEGEPGVPATATDVALEQEHD